MPYTSAFALWTSENWDTCHMTRLTALRLLYSGGSAIRFAGKERRKPACRIIQRSQGYWFVLCLLETLFRSPSSGKSPMGDGGVCRIRTGDTCLEGRCVTATLIRRKATRNSPCWSQHGHKLLAVASLTKRKVSNDGGHCRWNGWGSWIRTNGRLSHARVKVWCLTAWRYPNI